MRNANNQTRILKYVLPLLTAILMLHPLLLHPGVPYHGDETYYVKPGQSYLSLEPLLYSWSDYYGRPVHPDAVLYSLSLTPLTTVLGHELGVKAFLVIMLWATGAVAYFAVHRLLGFLNIFEPKLRTYVSIIGSLFYQFNFENPALIYGSNSFVGVYLALPLTFIFLTSYLARGRSIYLLSFCLSCTLATTTFALPFSLILLFPVCILIAKNYCAPIVALKRLSILLIATLAVLAFWFVPLIAGYMLRLGGHFATYGINPTHVQWASWYDLTDILLYGSKGAYMTTANAPNHLGPFGVVVTALVFGTLLLTPAKKNIHILFLALIGLVTIFLLKGANPPFANFYYYSFASKIPLALGGMLRHPTYIFTPPLAFIYAILVSYVVGVSCRLSKNFGKVKSRFKSIIPYLLIFVVFSQILHTSALYLNEYTWPRYMPTAIPEAYDEANSWLEEQEGNFKVMWWGAGRHPTGVTGWVPTWKTAGSISGFPGLYSTTTSFTTRLPEKWVWWMKYAYNAKWGELLSVFGIRYLIHHDDGPNSIEDTESGWYLFAGDDWEEKDPAVVYDDEMSWVSSSMGAGGSLTGGMVVEEASVVKNGMSSTKVEVSAGGTHEFVGVECGIKPSQDWRGKDLLCLFVYGLDDGGRIRIAVRTGAGNWRYWQLTDGWAGWRRLLLPLGKGTLKDSGAVDLGAVDTLVILWDTPGTRYVDRIVVDADPSSLPQSSTPSGLGMAKTFTSEQVNLEVFENAEYVGRVYAVGKALIVDDAEKALLNLLNEEWFDTNKYVVVEKHIDTGYTGTTGSEGYQLVGDDWEEKDPAVVYDDEMSWVSSSMGAGGSLTGGMVVEEASVVKNGMSSTKVEVSAGGTHEFVGVEYGIKPSQDWRGKDLLCLFVYGLDDGGRIRIAVRTGAGNWRYWQLTDGWAGWRRLLLPLGKGTLKDSGAVDLGAVDTLVILWDTPGTRYVDRIVVDADPSSLPRVVQSKQISPVEWEILAESNGPFILVFTEMYDNGWKAYVDGKECEHFEAYGVANGFYVEPHPFYTENSLLIRIRLYYTLQDFLHIGYLTTVVALLTLFYLVIREKSLFIKFRG